MHVPKIDYAMLGHALAEYEARGYRYVEVPWMVERSCIRATLPEQFDYMEVAVREPLLGPEQVMPHGLANGLVGSAEQGFLALNLPEGAYVGVTPCFRIEPKVNLFYQETFMKVELFVNRLDNSSEALVDHVLTDAREAMSLFTDAEIVEVETCEGRDLEIAGIEVGSYGKRSDPAYGKWVYGTGLALPRFSVASALAGVY